MDISKSGARITRCVAVGHITQSAAASCKCYHYEEEHEAGSRACDKQEKEKMLMKIQDEEKCHIVRARLILQKNNEFTDTSGKLCTTHFDCDMTENNERQFTSWLLEKRLQKIIGRNPKSVRSKSKSVYD